MSKTSAIEFLDSIRRELNKALDEAILHENEYGSKDPVKEQAFEALAAKSEAYFSVVSDLLLNTAIKAKEAFDAGLLSENDPRLHSLKASLMVLDSLPIQAATDSRFV